jgi:hypothetical protein
MSVPIDVSHVGSREVGSFNRSNVTLSVLPDLDPKPGIESRNYTARVPAIAFKLAQERYRENPEGTMRRHHKRVEVEYRENLFDTERIFREAAVQITPVTLEYFRHLRNTAGRRGYAFAIERQSLGKLKIGALDHTGHIGRVRAIERMAKKWNLNLPTPIDRENRQEGDPPFIFDTRCWYVDGEVDCATGLSLSPEIRPALWRCYATLRRITELDPSARPIAILIADECRFMRADAWLKLWFEAIKGEGVDLIFPEVGRVESAHLELLAMKIRTLSEHLPKYRAAALEVAKKQERIPWGKINWGLQYEDGGRSVVADPERWPVIDAVIHGLADGSLPSVLKAAAWARETYGMESCSEWLIRTWLRDGSFTEGSYVAFAKTWKPCKIKETNGIREDFSFTEGRNRRYVLQVAPEEEWLRKPVLHRHGTRSIPQEVLAAARRRTRKGRPPRTDRTGEAAWQVIPSRLIRCAVCEHLVRERGPEPPEKMIGQPKMRANWTLGCNLLQELRQHHGYTVKEIRAMPISQHVRYAIGSLSLPVIDLLEERLFVPDLDLTPHVGDMGTDLEGKRLQLETRQTALQRQMRVQTLTLEDVDPEEELDSVAQIRARMKELQAELTAVERELQCLAALTLTRHSTDRALREARQYYMTLAEEHRHSPDFWRAVIQKFVDRIEVNLETGEFEVTCSLQQPPLSGLVGRILRPR